MGERPSTSNVITRHLQLHTKPHNAIMIKLSITVCLVLLLAQASNGGPHDLLGCAITVHNNNLTRMRVIQKYENKTRARGQ